MYTKQVNSHMEKNEINKCNYNKHVLLNLVSPAGETNRDIRFRGVNIKARDESRYVEPV